MSIPLGISISYIRVISWGYSVAVRWMNGRMDGQMDGWMDGWIDGWVDGWVGGWMDGYVNR